MHLGSSTTALRWAAPLALVAVCACSATEPEVDYPVPFWQRDADGEPEGGEGGDAQEVRYYAASSPTAG